MAWNQPGGNGDKDPWSGRGGQQGPPDLDEVLKKLQSGLGRVFGGGGKGTGGGRTGGGFNIAGGGAKGIAIIALVAVLGWVVAGIYIVEPQEQGVVMRFGAFQKVAGPGPHWLPYFVDTVEKVNVELVRNAEIGYRTTGGSQGAVPRESLMLTEDENIIDIQFAVQYRVKSAPDYLFIDRDPDITLRRATESAVREIVGTSRMDFVITEGRSEVAASAQVLIQEILDRYGTGLAVLTVNMQNAQPPREVQDAFFDAVKAREDEERLKNEARAYAADIIPKARGEAAAVREAAEGYRQRVIAQAEGETDRFLEVLGQYQRAPEITRERLYLEALESVMANTSKVMVDVESGNSLMYLPLDKLLREREAAQQPPFYGGENETARLSEPTMTDNRRQRLDGRGRSR